MSGFGATGLQRLVALGDVTPERAAAMMRAWQALDTRPGARLVTPSVLELIARRR
jgi:hypothetical protein